LERAISCHFVPFRLPSSRAERTATTEVNHPFSKKQIDGIGKVEQPAAPASIAVPHDLTTAGFIAAVLTAVNPIGDLGLGDSGNGLARVVRESMVPYSLASWAAW